MPASVTRSGVAAANIVLATWSGVSVGLAPCAKVPISFHRTSARNRTRASTRSAACRPGAVTSGGCVKIGVADPTRPPRWPRSRSGEWVLLPKITVLRLLILVGFVVACSFAYDALSSPVRAVMVFVVIAGGSGLLQHWMRLDRHGREARREDPPGGAGGGRHVWRVRWWVRLVSVAIPLLGIPFVLWPRLLNPEWGSGVPAGGLVVMVLFYAVLGLAVWAAFRSRLDVDENVVRVVNPWKVRSVPRAEVRSARSGPWGLELLLDDGRVIVAFAVQCVGGYRPRWVEVARAITGQEPVR